MSELDAAQLGLALSGVTSLCVDEWRTCARVDRAGAGSDCTAAMADARAAAFFRVVGRFPDETRARLLFFSTGLKRLPGGGFHATRFGAAGLYTLLTPPR